MRSARGLWSSCTSHVGVLVLVVCGLVTDGCRFGRIAGPEICGGLVRREGVGLLAGAELSVAVLGLSLPELAAGRAGRVAVVGGGPEGFLLLVVAHEGDFEGY